MVASGRSRPLVRGLASPAILAGLACLAALAGCGAFSEAPRVEVDSLSIVRVDDDAVEADLTVRIRGAGADAIVLTDFRYGVFLEGRRAYAGRWAALAAAPPEEAIVRILPVVVPRDRLPEEIAAGADVAWSVAGSVGWRDPDRFARILLDLGFATPRADFSGRGASIAAATEAAATGGARDFVPVEAPLAP